MLLLIQQEVQPQSALLQATTIDPDGWSPEERQPKQLGQHSRSLCNTPGEGCMEKQVLSNMGNWAALMAAPL